MEKRCKEKEDLSFEKKSKEKDHLSYEKCKVCSVKFEGHTLICELPCLQSHVISKDCADKWFNTDRHINCPICLENIYKV